MRIFILSLFLLTALTLGWPASSEARTVASGKRDYLAPPPDPFFPEPKPEPKPKPWVPTEEDFGIRPPILDRPIDPSLIF